VPTHGGDLIGAFVLGEDVDAGPSPGMTADVALTNLQQ
jgi:hypothetical protein